MKQRHYWLLALLSILILMTTTTLAIAEEAMTSGHAEIGVSGMNTDDNPARVNEYGTIRSEEGLSLAPKISLESIGEKSSLSIDAEIMGRHDQKIDFELDAMRMFRLKTNYSVLDHWKDHETLSQMGATARDDIGGAQPNVTTDKIYADLIRATGNPGVTIGGASPVANNPRFTGLSATQAADLLEADFNQEVNNDYIVTRRELKNDVDIALPVLPNIVFHAGLRIETREGMEQAIGLSKCGGCHVSASGKDIDERTEEFTLGATGKFGILTVDYEYLTRDFEEQANAPSRWYITPAADAGGLVKESSLLYAEDDYKFGKTPDSEKDSHLLKARVDFDRTTISASYMNADVESTKTDEPGIYELDDKTLTSEYDGFNGKIATAFGPVRLSFRGGYYEIEGPEYSVTFDKRDDPPAYGRPQTHEMDNTDHYVSAESREVTEFAVDAVYRLATATTLRLGYEYENVDRTEEELGETETHTIKAAIKSRFSRAFSGRISYEYQDISDPFVAHNATGIAQGNPDYYDPTSGLAYLDAAQFQGVDGNDNWVYYWNSVYPSRGFDATNQADAVHEVKLSTTWSPSANMAATFFLRGRYEENDDVHYQQDTFVPGISFWYAPSNNVNLTAAYTYSYQDTENRACVGWYHG